MPLIDLKRKFPSLNDKGDEELLADNEEPVKRPEAPCVVWSFLLKQILIFYSDVYRNSGSGGSPVNLTRPETMVHSKDTIQKIRDTIEAALSRQRDLDHHWEDLVDVSFVGSVF